MHNLIFSQTLNPAQMPVVQVQPRNVGLITKFMVEVTGTIQNNGTAALTPTQFGLANLFSNITFYDIQNNQRINTTGWHLSMLSTARYRRPYAAGYLAETDEMSSYGENFPIIVAPASIAASSSATFRAVFEVPLAYSDDDLRGAMYANLINVSSQLNLTINPTPFALSTNNSTMAMYMSTAAPSAVISSLTIDVYQHYLYNLPTGSNGQVILPVMDTNIGYLLNVTQFPNIVPNVQNPFPFTNYRDFMSAFAVFDNNSAGAGGLSNGSDVNTWALQQANFTNFWQDGPLTVQQRARETIQTDFPLGVYYFSFRKKTLNTTTYGNMELVLNPKTSPSGIVYMGYESTALLNTIGQATSLPA
ncbi:MAG: hypothetical protein ACP5EP_12265 [Acidobacteriaceae bacterium]